MRPRSLLILLGIASVMTAGTWWLATPESTLEQDSSARARELTLQAERDANEGTGTYDPSRSVRLITTCHEAVRRELRKFAHTRLDEGISPREGYIYEHSFQGRRIVGLQQEQNSYSSTGNYPPLMAPIEGRYRVVGHVAYSDQPIAGANYDHRAYECDIDVDGDRYAVKDVELRLVK